MKYDEVGLVKHAIYANTEISLLTMKSMCPAGWLVLLQFDEAIMILVMKLHVPLRPVHHLTLHLLEVPLGELVGSDEAVSRVDIDLGKELHNAIGDIETLLVVDVILGVHEVLPLGLGLHSGGVALRKEVSPLPLAVLTAALDVSNNGVKGNTSAVAAGLGGEVGG